MLVLQRKVDQGIRIGDDIQIVILGVSGDHVKLGIDAPRHIRVLRYELLEDVQEENRRAAAAAAVTPPAALPFLRTAPHAPLGGPLARPAPTSPMQPPAPAAETLEPPATPVQETQQ